MSALILALCSLAGAMLLLAAFLKLPTPEKTQASIDHLLGRRVSALTPRRLVALEVLSSLACFVGTVLWAPLTIVPALLYLAMAALLAVHLRRGETFACNCLGMASQGPTTWRAPVANTAAAIVLVIHAIAPADASADIRAATILIGIAAAATALLFPAWRRVRHLNAQPFVTYGAIVAES